MVEGKETAPFICVFICESVRSPTDELLKDATVLDQQFSGGNGSKDWGGGGLTRVLDICRNLANLQKFEFLQK